MDFWQGAENLALSSFLIRSVIIYLYLFLIVKVLGQRSIGSMQPLDFIFGVVIGDILGEPLSSGDIAFSGPLVSATMISFLHLSLSYIALKMPRFRRVLEDEPIVIIEKGKILREQMHKTKLTMESLLMDLRLRQAADLNDVDYAILESNGQISVIKKSNNDSVKPMDLNIGPLSPKGYPTVLIMDGAIIHANLKKVGTLNWLQEQVHKKGFKNAQQVMLMTMNEDGSFYTSPK